MTALLEYCGFYYVTMYAALDHSILLQCLSNPGILGKELKWFMDYLKSPSAMC